MGRLPLALSAGAVALLALIGVCAVAVIVTNVLSWDDAILGYSDRHLYDAAVADVVRLFLWASIGAGALAAGLAVASLAMRRRWRPGAFVLVAVGASLVLDPLLKEIFRRPGLGERGEYSFPSGTASLAVAVVASIALTVPPRWRNRVLIVGVPIVVANGLALVYLWWHYPSDVLAGWCITLFWVSVLWIALQRIAQGQTPPGACATSAE